MRVRFFAMLRDVTGTKEIDWPLVERTTVRDVLTALAFRHPKVGEMLWDANGRLSGRIAVFLNKRPLQTDEEIERPLETSDELSLFPPLGGGALKP
jgi:MoaD family protein